MSDETYRIVGQLAARIERLERKVHELETLIDGVRYDDERERGYLTRRIDALRSDLNDIASG